MNNISPKNRVGLILDSLFGFSVAKNRPEPVSAKSKIFEI